MARGPGASCDNCSWYFNEVGCPLNHGIFQICVTIEDDGAMRFVFDLRKAGFDGPRLLKQIRTWVTLGRSICLISGVLCCGQDFDSRDVWGWPPSLKTPYGSWPSPLRQMCGAEALWSYWPRLPPEKMHGKVSKPIHAANNACGLCPGWPALFLQLFVDGMNLLSSRRKNT